jgi:hypothetical protein
VILSRSRRLACSLALLCGLTQPLLSSHALAGALALVASHGHALSILADDGHFDLVLSHATSASDARHAAEQHVHAASASESTHVVHLGSGELARDSMRRGAQVDQPAAGAAQPIAWKPPCILAREPARDRLARARRPLQTIVLRI